MNKFITHEGRFTFLQRVRKLLELGYWPEAYWRLDEEIPPSDPRWHSSEATYRFDPKWYGGMVKWMNVRDCGVD